MFHDVFLSSNYFHPMFLPSAGSRAPGGVWGIKKVIMNSPKKAIHPVT
jgi:hypothetical protein